MLRATVSVRAKSSIQVKRPRQSWFCQGLRENSLQEKFTLEENSRTYTFIQAIMLSLWDNQSFHNRPVRSKTLGADLWPEEETGRILVIPWAEVQHKRSKEEVNMVHSSGSSLLSGLTTAQLTLDPVNRTDSRLC